MYLRTRKEREEKRLEKEYTYCELQRSTACGILLTFSIVSAVDAKKCTKRLIFG